MLRNAPNKMSPGDRASVFQAGQIRNESADAARSVDVSMFVNDRASSKLASSRPACYCVPSAGRSNRDRRQPYTGPVKSTAARIGKNLQSGITRSARPRSPHCAHQPLVRLHSAAPSVGEARGAHRLEQGLAACPGEARRTMVLSRLSLATTMTLWMPGWPFSRVQRLSEAVNPSES